MNTAEINQNINMSESVSRFAVHTSFGLSLRFYIANIKKMRTKQIASKATAQVSSLVLLLIIVYSK
jgi:hypothetical protein